MAIPKTVGRDKRGNPVYLRSIDGFNILDEDNCPTIDDELPYVAAAFQDWRKGIIDNGGTSNNR